MSAKSEIPQPFRLTSFSSNGSPHSGQNFGGCAGSGGLPAAFIAAETGAPACCFAPHSEQNLPVLTAPQAHVQPSAGLALGFFAPHSGKSCRWPSRRRHTSTRPRSAEPARRCRLSPLRAHLEELRRVDPDAAPSHVHPHEAGERAAPILGRARLHGLRLRADQMRRRHFASRKTAFFCSSWISSPRRPLRRP